MNFVRGMPAVGGSVPAALSARAKCPNYAAVSLRWARSTSAGFSWARLAAALRVRELRAGVIARVDTPSSGRNAHPGVPRFLSGSRDPLASTIEIRDAHPSDAVTACEVLWRSITELCVADHHDDPRILARWLANKTPEIVASWIARPGNSVILAIKNDDVIGVGAVIDEGHILLNYVSPAARFQGVSRALLRALEARAIERGNNRCTLDSTKTARRFYLSAGYSEEHPPRRMFGTASYPMSKRLSDVA